MRGMYDVDMSGDTDKIAIRGSEGTFEEPSVVEVAVEGLINRFISGRICQITAIQISRSSESYDTTLS